MRNVVDIDYIQVSCGGDRGTSHTLIFHIKVCLQVLRSTTANVRKTFVAPGGATQVMSLETTCIAAEDYTFENEKNLRVWS